MGKVAFLRLTHNTVFVEIFHRIKGLKYFFFLIYFSYYASVENCNSVDYVECSIGFEKKKQKYTNNIQIEILRKLMNLQRENALNHLIFLVFFPFDVSESETVRFTMSVALVLLFKFHNPPYTLSGKWKINGGKC